MERINTIQGTQSTVLCSKRHDNFYFFYLNVTDPLIIPLIVLPCREKAHDNNEFCRKN